MDVALTIDYLVPKAKYIGSVHSNTESEYNAIRWRDNRPKPLWADILAATIAGEDEYEETIVPLGQPSELLIFDRKLSWQPGGTWTAWAWRTHTLTSIEHNNIVGSSLANHQITLPAGTYWAEFNAEAYRVEKYIYRLYNMTLDNNTPLIESLTGYSRNTVHASVDTVVGVGRFVLTDTSVIELQGYGQNTQVTDGFGIHRNLGDVGGYNPDNIYASIHIRKVG